jgi:hypothetical protein
MGRKPPIRFISLRPQSYVTFSTVLNMSGITSTAANLAKREQNRTVGSGAKI